MLLKISEYFFLITSVLLIFSIIIFKLVILRIVKDNLKLSKYVAFISAMIFLYFISGITAAIFIPGVIKKIVLLSAAFSPFVIGKLATYKTEKIFTILQILTIFWFAYICFEVI